MQYKLGERWLLYSGISKNELNKKYKAALSRANRYPIPHRFLFHVLLKFANWFGALILLKKLTLASFLNKSDFEVFVVKIKEHPLPYIRIAGMLLWQPFIEVLKEDVIIPKNNIENHPLQKQIHLPPKNKAHEETDYVIIGSGAGGAPIAYELSKQGQKVIVVEKGDIVLPGTTSETLEKHYIGQALTVSTTGSTVLVMAGSAVGGTTPINSGTCLRPLNRCLHIWDGQLDTSFASGELEPYLNKVEQDLKICLPHESLMSNSAILFEKGLKKINRNGAFILPRNAENCIGSGRCCFGCPIMAKQSTDIAYLPKAIMHGAQLWIKTKAVEIKEKDNYVFINTESESGKNIIKSKYLIIAAGAILTPGIILRNHLGYNQHNVGKYLKIHPASKVFAYFPDYDLTGAGIPQCLGYHPPEIENVTLEAIHTPESIIAPIISAAGSSFKWWLNNASHLASFGLMIQDKGHGCVKEFFDLPWIKYTMHKNDVADFVRGLKIIGEVFFAAGATKVLLPFLGHHQKEYSSIEELNKIIPESIKPTELIVSGFHPQGTAGMGRVVDNNLKLIGSKNIYVCDASVLPDSPGVNPQLTIMALSLRLADYLTNAIVKSN